MRQVRPEFSRGALQDRARGVPHDAIPPLETPERKPRVLVLVNTFLPGFKAGGPIKTIAGLVHHLQDDFDFSIITADRDSGDTAPYASVRPDEWQEAYGARVFYASPQFLHWRRMMRLVRDTPHDVLYLNSFFNKHFAVGPLLARSGRARAKGPLVVAPRGEFARGVLRTSPFRKRLYFDLVRRLGVLSGAVWHATDAAEAELLPAALVQGPVVTASNLRPPTLSDCTDGSEAARKTRGRMRVVCISRVTPVKNLAQGMRWFDALSGEVILDVYGSASRENDRAYLQECRRVAGTLPRNVRVTFHGPIPPNQVRRELRRSHLFFLPTLGENFGHAILEALIEGCPPLVSDTTPWRGLESAHAGWDLPLEDEAKFRSVLAKVVAMDHAEWAEWARGARAYGAGKVNPPEAIEQHRLLFRTALDAYAQPKLSQGAGVA